MLLFSRVEGNLKHKTKPYQSVKGLVLFSGRVLATLRIFACKIRVQLVIDRSNELLMKLNFRILSNKEIQILQPVRLFLLSQNILSYGTEEILSMQNKV